MTTIKTGGRQTGRTTAAIQRAPQDAIYLVQNENQADYTRHLAETLLRTDLRVMTVAEFLRRYHGLDLPVVTDHHVSMDWEQRAVLFLYLSKHQMRHGSKAMKP